MPLAEFDVLHQRLCQAVADLLQIQVAERRCHFLRVETVAAVPGRVALLLLDEWIPSLLLRLALTEASADLILDILAHGEHLVELSALRRHGPLLLSAVLFHVCLGLRLLRRRRHLAFLLLGGPQDAIVLGLRTLALLCLGGDSKRGLLPRILGRLVRLECVPLALTH